jgi:hypothetical protein
VSWSVERRRQLVEDLGEALAMATSIHDPRAAEALLDAAPTWAGLSDSEKTFLRGLRRRSR